MRCLLLALLSFFCVSCASNGIQPKLTSVDIKEIKPRYIEDESFKRVSEYLTGIENTGKRVIVRSDRDAEQRDGFYFVLILNERVRDLPSGTEIVGEFYTPKSTEAETHRFKLPAKRSKTKEIFVGLTGEDWPYDPSVVPSAWKFTIQDANGRILGTKESFLWSQ